ncbi:MAG: amino acid-binding ACT domain-containing protein [Deinococcota bacterium]
MDDISVQLAHTPGALAQLGEVLGNAGISLEGGGVFVHDGIGVAHFLVEDGAAAATALNAVNIDVIGYNPVLVQRLRQDQPGQLGKLTRHMADAGVNIEVMYSDHDNQLILVVDDMVKGQQVSDKWQLEHTTS